MEVSWNTKILHLSKNNSNQKPLKTGPTCPQTSCQGGLREADTQMIQKVLNIVETCEGLTFQSVYYFGVPWEYLLGMYIYS